MPPNPHLPPEAVEAAAEARHRLMSTNWPPPTQDRITAAMLTAALPALHAAWRETVKGRFRDAAVDDEASPLMLMAAEQWLDKALREGETTNEH